MDLRRLARLVPSRGKRPRFSKRQTARTAAFLDRLGNSGFVRLAYQLILERPADLPGHEHLLDKLEHKQITRAAIVRNLFESEEFRERCLPLCESLHHSRLEIIRQLPAAEVIVDLGGTCIEDERGALVVMGYPYSFTSLTIVDLPPALRHDLYADGRTEHRAVVRTTSGPVRYIYTSMVDLSALADESVDLVYAGQSIEHVARDQAAQVCREAWRILKPGGFYCLDTPNRAVTRVESPDHLINPDHKHEYTHAELSDLLLASGFAIQEAKGLVLLRDSVRHGRIIESEFRKRQGVFDDIENCYLLYYRCRKKGG